MAGGRIAGITIELNGDATKLTKALADVDRSARQSQNNLKDINKLLKLDPGNTELLQQKFTNLTTSIDSTKQRLETLKEAAAQMKLAGNDNGPEWDALQREIAETEQKLKGLNAEMDKFGSVGAQKIAAAGEQVQQVGEKIEGAGKAIMPASAAVIGFGTVAASKYAEVDKVMTLTNQTMGNTADQAELLESAMAKAASNSTYGMSDAANACLNFARAGLTAEESAAALAPAMNLAAGEGGNLDTVSAGLVATINGFHDTFDNASHYADVFAAACNNSALDVDSLSHAMSVAAPIFASAGYSVNDAALYMGVMANNGIDADKAANSLKTGLARLVSPAKQGAEMMEKLGISVTNADGSMKDSITIQKELHDAFSKLSESEQIAAASAIFGKNQMAPWLALINTAPSEVDELSNSLSNCAGTTDEMANAMMSGFGGSIEQLKSSLDVLMTMLGKTLSEFLVPIIQSISSFLNWLNSLDAGTRRIIVTIGMVIAAAGPVLIFIGKVTQGVGALMKLAPTIVTAFGKIKTVVGVVGGALKGLWAAMLANPITIVIAAIAALVAGFIYLWNNSEEFRQFWINLWENIKNAVQVAWEAITTWITTAWENIRTTAETVWTAISTFFSTTWENIRLNIETAWTAITTFFSTAWENIRILAETVWNAIVEFFTTTWTNITTGVTTAWTNITTAIQTAMTNIQTAITTAWEAIKAFFSSVLSAIGSAVSSAWSNIKSNVTTAMSNIKSNVTTAWNNIKSTVTTVLSNIGSAITNGFNTAKNNVTNALNAIKDKIKSVWDGAVSLVRGAVDKLKSLMNFHWELPKLKLPHISITGHFSINPPSVPHFSIEWYKKAMENGMILNSPTILPGANGTLRGFGDAGPEAVVGVDSLRGMIGEAVAAAANGLGGDITIPVYIGQQRIDTIVVKAMQRTNYRSGGR